MNVTTNQDSPRWVDTHLEPFRCRTCQAKLAMISKNFQIRKGEMLQVKCSKCKTMNYLFGAEE